MSYLLDRKNKRKRFSNIILVLVFIILVFIFRTPFWSGSSYVANVVFRPILIVKNSIGGFFSGISGSFSFKNNLVKENEDLRNKLNENSNLLINYNSILDENTKLKEILERKEEKTKVVLAAILSKPNINPYDTLIIDAGLNHNIKVGDTVFALGNIPIGHVRDVYPNSSKVILFSNSGEKTEVVVGDKGIFMQIVGRGGGNFEMIMPRDFSLTKGSSVSLPGINSNAVAISQATLSDPRDSFEKALLVSPVNIQEIKFVQVKI